MNGGTTSLSDRQFAELESLAAAGLGPIAILAELDGSPLFSDRELQGLRGGGKSGPQAIGASSGDSSGWHVGLGGSKGKGNGKDGSSGGEGWIQRLIPAVLRGDRSNQSSTTGTQYQPPTTLSPTIAGGQSSSPILLIGLLAVLGVGVFFIFRKHPREEHQR